MSYFEKYPDPPYSKPTASRWWSVLSTTGETRRWDLADFCIVVGLGLFVAGVALVSKPAALIVGGVLLAGLAVLGSQR